MPTNLQSQISALIDLLPKWEKNALQWKINLIHQEIKNAIEGLIAGKIPVGQEDFEERITQNQTMIQQKLLSWLPKENCEIFQTLSLGEQARFLERCEEWYWYQDGWDDTPPMNHEHFAYITQSVMSKSLALEENKYFENLYWSLEFNFFKKAELTKYFERISKTQRLRIDKNPFIGMKCDQTQSLISKLTDVKYLNINMEAFDRDTLEAFCSSFPNLTTLVIDDVYSNPLTCQWIKTFLRWHSNVTHIDMKEIFLDSFSPADRQELFSLLPNVKKISHEFQEDKIPLEILTSTRYLTRSLRDICISGEEINNKTLSKRCEIFSNLPNLRAVRLKQWLFMGSLRLQELEMFFSLLKNIWLFTFENQDFKWIKKEHIKVSLGQLSSLRYLEIKETNLPKNQSIIKPFAKSISQITSLQLNDCGLEKLSPNNLTCFFSALKNLTHLTLHAASLEKLTPEQLAAILNHLPQLKKLIIKQDNLSEWTQEHWEVIQNAQQIKHITLSNAWKFDGETLHWLDILYRSGMAFAHLTSLDMDSFGLNIKGSDSIKCFYEPLINLKRIKVYDESIPNIEKYVPELKGKLFT